MKVEPEVEDPYEGLEDLPLLDLLDLPYPHPQEDLIRPTTPGCPSPLQPDNDAEMDEVMAGGCVVDESFSFAYPNGPENDDSDYDPEDEDSSSQRLSRKRRVFVVEKDYWKELLKPNCQQRLAVVIT